MIENISIGDKLSQFKFKVGDRVKIKFRICSDTPEINKNLFNGKIGTIVSVNNLRFSPNSYQVQLLDEEKSLLICRIPENDLVKMIKKNKSSKLMEKIDSPEFKLGEIVFISNACPMTLTEGFKVIELNGCRAKIISLIRTSHLSENISYKYDVKLVDEKNNLVLKNVIEEQLIREYVVDDLTRLRKSNERLILKNDELKNKISHLENLVKYYEVLASR